ncbi:hypothetical protein BX616_001151 [Lobosporangium transversale]|nr:hypothetical protein BX616_001151 [Lobosporangium transversale]
MSAFPKFPPNGNKKFKVDGNHVFFSDQKVHPNDWTPWNFANYQFGNNFSEYLQGLQKLRRAGKSAICCHAREILQWIDNPSNENLVLQAKTRIAEKISGQIAEMAANARKYEDVTNMPTNKRSQIGCNENMRNHSMDGLDSLSLGGLEELEVPIFKISRKLLRQTHLSMMETKDLMVAMSGILDLRTWDCDRAPSAIEPTLYSNNDDIGQLNTQLSKTLRLGVQMFALNCDVKIGEIAEVKMQGGDVPTSTPMLRLVSHFANLIERGNIPVSEGEFVGLWKATLEILSEGHLKFLSGEKVCKATQAAKRQFKEIFGVEGETDSGRRVDLLLRIGDMEILNTEAKALGCDIQCEQQYKKNIRINHAIYQEARRSNIDLPPILLLDIRGFSAMVCQLRKASDTVFIAGAAHERMITLPSNQDELHKFLDGQSPQILWNYASYLVVYQNQILTQLEKAKDLSTTTNTKRKMMSFDDDVNINNKHDTERPCTPPKNRLLKIGDTTVFTPKKSVKQIKLGQQQ